MTELIVFSISAVMLILGNVTFFLLDKLLEKKFRK
jgi:hypothetical protein